MAFMLRRPLALAATIAREAPKTHFAATVRSFQTTANNSAKQTFAKQATPVRNAFGSQQQNAFRQAFRQSKRSYQTTAPANPLAQGNLTQRLIYGAGIFGGTLVAINLVFNRETRDDGGMPPYERSYLNDTFLHTGLGLGIIAIAAGDYTEWLVVPIDDCEPMARNGCWSCGLPPWLVMGVGLVASIGTMMGARATPPENYMLKYGLWAGFNVTQAALLAPLMFFNPAILARAGLYTVGIMGSIAFVGATAKQDKYLYLGGPLLAGVAVVALSGLAPLVLPVTATRTLMITENLWLYGGLAVFCGFTLYDVQKILAHARMAQRGMMKRDVVNESISLELDFINIFVRLVQILALQQNRRR